MNYECVNYGEDGDEDTTPFTRMARDMEDISPNKDGGVLKSILRHGAGAIVPPTALCRVHYNAYFEFNDEPFDSSYIRNRQKQFKLGNGEVLTGMRCHMLSFPFFFSKRPLRGFLPFA